MNATRLPELIDVFAARKRLRGIVRETPMMTSSSLSRLVGAPVRLKLEHHQVTGSFKLRGAVNAVARLDETERKRGVVAVSTGNHGRALAHAASAMGVRCIVAVSRLAPENKIAGIREEGAEVRVHGDSQDEAQTLVERLVAEEGMVMLPPFDHADIIAGQGTLGLETIEAAPELETVLVPVSGGGLVAGVALAMLRVKPELSVIGVSMARGAAMHASLAAGRPVAVEEKPSLADSLGGGIGEDNRYTLAMVRDLVERVVLVSEADIAAAVRHAYLEERQIVEGGAAVGMAALLAGKVTVEGPTAVILSGGNIDMNLHQGLIRGELPSWCED